MADGTVALKSYITKNGVTLADIRNIGGHNTTRNITESTELGDEWKTYLPTFFESQDITFNCLFDYTGYHDLFTALTTGTLDTYNMYLSDVDRVVTYTDSEGHLPHQFEQLEDGITNTGAVTHPTGWGTWIILDFGKLVNISRISVWCTASPYVYIVAYNGSSWDYYATDGTHSLTDNTLVQVANQAAAEASYWNAPRTDYRFWAKFPTTLTASQIQVRTHDLNVFHEIHAGHPSNEFNAYVTDLKVTETNGSEIISYDCTLRTSGAMTIL